METPGPNTFVGHTRTLRIFPWFLVSALVAATLGLINSDPAEAAWWDGASCANRTSTTYQFSGDSEWSDYPGFAAMVGYGIDEWEEVDNKSGGSVFSASSGSSFTLKWDSLSSTTYASTGCPINGYYVKYNNQKLAEYDTGVPGGLDIQGVTTHEFGHVYGIGHAGRYDTQPPNANDLPTMATCLSSPDQTKYNWRTLSQDDHAAGSRIGDKVTYYSVYWGSTTPNSSFEDGTRFWRKQNVSSWGTYSGGADSTPKYLAFAPSASNGAVYAENRITNPGSHLMVARANYRRLDPASSGQIKLTFKWGQVTYQSGGYCGTTFNNKNLNVETYDGGWTTKQNKYCSVSSSWNYCTTSSYSTSWDAVDARVVVYSQMYTGSEHVGVKVDRVRILAVN